MSQISESLSTRMKRLSAKSDSSSSASTAASISPVIMSVIPPDVDHTLYGPISRCKKCVCGAASHLQRERVRSEELEKSIFSQKEKLLSQISKLDCRKQEPVSKLASAWEQLNSKFAEIKELEKIINLEKLNEFNNRNQIIENEIHSLSAPSRDAHIEGTQSEISELIEREKELDRLIDTIDDRKAELKTLEEEKAKLDQEFAGVSAINQRLLEEMAVMEESVEVKKSKFDEIQKLKIKLSETILIKSKRNQELKNYQTRLEKRREELESTREALERKEAEILQTLSEEHQRKELEEKIRTIESRIGTSRVDRLDEKIAEMSSEIESIKFELIQLTGIISEFLD